MGCHRGRHRGGGSDLLTVYRPPRPAELVGTASSLAAPALLASMLGLGALVALGFALIASVRGRRRELAVVKSSGFVRRQVQGVVLTQTLVTVVIGSSWASPSASPWGASSGASSRQLGVVAEQDIPTLAILVYAGPGSHRDPAHRGASPDRVADPAALVPTQE